MGVGELLTRPRKKADERDSKRIFLNPMQNIDMTSVATKELKQTDMDRKVRSLGEKVSHPSSGDRSAPTNQHFILPSRTNIRRTYLLLG